jgi:hypothetical protein
VDYLPLANARSAGLGRPLGVDEAGRFDLLAQGVLLAGHAVGGTLQELAGGSLNGVVKGIAHNCTLTMPRLFTSEIAGE